MDRGARQLRRLLEPSEHQHLRRGRRRHLAEVASADRRRCPGPPALKIAVVGLPGRDATAVVDSPNCRSPTRAERALPVDQWRATAARRNWRGEDELLPRAGYHRSPPIPSHQVGASGRGRYCSVGAFRRARDTRSIEPRPITKRVAGSSAPEFDDLWPGTRAQPEPLRLARCGWWRRSRTHACPQDLFRTTGDSHVNTVGGELAPRSRVRGCRPRDAEATKLMTNFARSAGRWPAWSLGVPLAAARAHADRRPG